MTINDWDWLQAWQTDYFSWRKRELLILMGIRAILGYHAEKILPGDKQPGRERRKHEN